MDLSDIGHIKSSKGLWMSLSINYEWPKLTVILTAQIITRKVVGSGCRDLPIIKTISLRSATVSQS